MELIIAPNKEYEWTVHLLENPNVYLGGSVSQELEENHPIAAIAERGRLMAVSMVSGDIAAESKIADIFSSPKNPINKLEMLLNYAREGGLSGKKFQIDVPNLAYSARGTIVPSSEFYVLPTFENGQRSTSRSLRQNKKIDLIQRIWQALPAGYGVGIKDNSFGSQYYLSVDGPSTELIDVEIFGNTRAEVTKGVIPFANKKYDSGAFHSEDDVLNRQIQFILTLGKYNHNNKVKTYQQYYKVSKETAKREIQALVDEEIVTRLQKTPWILRLKDSH